MISWSKAQIHHCLQWPLLPGGDEPQPPNAELRLCVRAPHRRRSAGLLHDMMHRCLQWPLLPGGAEPQPPNAELRLYGGAAFERAVAEFQEAARLLAMPPGAGVNVRV
jgi:hypothetical protein